MILNKKWEKVTLEKTKDTGIIYLDAKELKSPEGRRLNLPYSISEKVFIEWKEVKDKIYPDKMPFYAYSVTAVDKILNKENKMLQNLESFLNMDLIFSSELCNLLIVINMLEMQKRDLYPRKKPRRQ